MDQYRDPETGKPNQWALREAAAIQAGNFYLAIWKALGHQQAALETCERFGHVTRSGRCDRCGLGADARRLQFLAGKSA